MPSVAGPRAAATSASEASIAGLLLVALGDQLGQPRVDVLGADAEAVEHLLGLLERLHHLELGVLERA